MHIARAATRPTCTLIRSFQRPNAASFSQRKSAAGLCSSYRLLFPLHLLFSRRSLGLAFVTYQLYFFIFSVLSMFFPLNVARLILRSVARVYCPSRTVLCDYTIVIDNKSPSYAVLVLLQVVFSACIVCNCVAWAIASYFRCARSFQPIVLENLHHLSHQIYSRHATSVHAGQNLHHIHW
jgi:hypothetical protein